MEKKVLKVSENNVNFSESIWHVFGVTIHPYLEEDNARFILTVQTHTAMLERILAKNVTVFIL